MAGRLSLAYQLERHFGLNWLLYRAWYAASLRSGWVRWRYPAAPWSRSALSRCLQDANLADPDAYLAYRRQSAPPFFFNPARAADYQTTLRRWDSGQTPVETAAALARGTFTYFSHLSINAGLPPDWHKNPLTGQQAPAARHWSQIGDFAFGDIKLIWEASRFGFVFALVRAYWRTGDEALAELFWQLLLDWQAHNPPQQGPNWKCGQETSLRLMAWCFGLYGFLHSPATTAARVAALGQMVAASGERIEANLRYALSQRNNHGVSEGMGLWTIGLLFPEFKSAARWRRKGRQVLETLARTLIYDDGSFSQHSANYHRLMLHDYAWSWRLGELLGQPLSADLGARVARAGEWLYQLQEGQEGELPAVGQNDGALILPLTNCAYADYRPVIQAIAYLRTRTRCYDDGPWDELLFWLFGEEATTAPVSPGPRGDWAAPDGGYHVLRSAHSMAFVRCGQLRDRPAQADMLHVDLWWHGRNVALDAGTYSYNAPPPWDNALAATRVHNTVIVDGQEQMARAGKFLWLPWAHGQVQAAARSADGRLAYWQGTHDGYRRLPDPVQYRRGIVQVGPDTWLLLDQLHGRLAHGYRLHWLLADYPYVWDNATGKLQLHAPFGALGLTLHVASDNRNFDLVRAAPDSPRGWHAPIYASRQPALSVSAETTGAEARFLSLIGPGALQLALANGQVVVTGGDWQTVVTLAQAAERTLVSTVTQTGRHVSELLINS